MQTDSGKQFATSSTLPNSEPFVVVCGCPRSGTYLLCSMLEAGLDIAFPIESHFIPLFSRYINLWEPLENTQNRLRLLSAIRRFTKIWVYHGIRSRKPEQQADLSLLPILEEKCRNVSIPDGNNYAAIVNELFSAYASKHGNRYYGDKSAYFEPVSLRLFDNSIPNMRVINIIRDGRDVALSWQKGWFGPRTLAEAALMWKQYLELHREWGKLNPSRYLEVRYEDLVTSPEGTLLQIANFLGIPATYKEAQKTKNSKLVNMLRDETTHPLIDTPPDPGNIEKWRKEMSHADIAFFEFIGGPTLKSSGYHMTTKNIKTQQKFIFSLRIAGGIIRRYLTVPYWLRRFRNVLPFFLRFTA